ncbi:hypothetical protein JCM10212_004839 [Sporobolomyces blumeae]
MRPSPSVALSSSRACLARRPQAYSAHKDPLDMANLVGPAAQPFDFPLTRPTLLKQAKQRQILHYLRLEQLQFNDLVAFRKPFTPPTAESFVQVRHQHYQGERHPASRKVTISVPVSRLPIARDPKQLHKFKLVAGARFTPTLAAMAGPRPSSTRSSSDDGRSRSAVSGATAPDPIGTFKLSCELFPSDKMNEKWCSDTLDRLVDVSRDVAGDEAFADVPLDQRGVRKALDKKRVVKRSVGLKDFPQEWLPRS